MADGAVRVIASFAGAGVLGPAEVLRVLEALEQRRAFYHKQVPGECELALHLDLHDTHDPIGSGCRSTRTVEVAWDPWHREPELSCEGLDGLRPRLARLPAEWLGLRVRLGYAFPAARATPLEAVFLRFDGGRYEVQLAFPAPEVMLADGARAMARTLLVADLAEGVYDVLAPAYGAIRPDAGVLADAVPASGWAFYGPVAVERAGRSALVELAGHCFKSWELADSGWFLAPAALGAVDEGRAARQAALFRACRHLTLETMRAAPSRVPRAVPARQDA